MIQTNGAFIKTFIVKTSNHRYSLGDTPNCFLKATEK